MLDNFEWPKAEDEGDEIVIRNVRKRGCHIVGIPFDERGPGYEFSIGLFVNYGHSEVVIFGLDPHVSVPIINDVRDRAAAGRTFVAGDICDDLLVGYKVCFVEVPLVVYPEYLGTAIWFYGNPPRKFPCLQIVWPDRDGLFPWDAGCDPGVKDGQPLLKKKLS
jgi:Domain of unknown function (DUF4262)